jgi:hypothetical protein
MKIVYENTGSFEKFYLFPIDPPPKIHSMYGHDSPFFLIFVV